MLRRQSALRFEINCRQIWSWPLPVRVGLSRFLQWRFNSTMMRWLPLRAGRAYLGVMGRIYYFINRKEKQQITENISAVIRKLPARKPTDLVIRQTFQGIFAHYHEKLFTGYCHYKKLCCFLRRYVELENQHLLDEALRRGRGVILVTGHFGGVEFLPSTLALRGYPVTMVVRFKTERLKRTLNRRAQRAGITLLDANEGEGVVFKALEALRSGRILITECDEFKAWRPQRGRATTFLGHSSPLDRTLNLLQRRSRSPVVMGMVCRGNGKRYSLKLCSLDRGGEQCEADTVGERALHVLERFIYLAPHQWYQWKDLRIILGTQIFEKTRPTRALEADRPVSIADSPLHAHQA
ncbi:MAG: lysophospholipid acyltransferase family protein [Syntrophobacteria bacterium]